MSGYESDGYIRSLLEQIAAAVPIHTEQWVRQHAGAAAAKGRQAEGYPQIGLSNELIVEILEAVRPLPPLPDKDEVLYVYHVNRGGTAHMVDLTPDVERLLDIEPFYVDTPSRCGEEPDNDKGTRVHDQSKYSTGMIKAWGIVPLQEPPAHMVCVACRRNVNPYKVQDEQPA